MELSWYIEQVYGIEDYSESKKEPFLKIQQLIWMSPENIISIWDQEHSDIIPAKELGMQALHVKWPQDLISLL